MNQIKMRRDEHLLTNKDLFMSVFSVCLPVSSVSSLSMSMTDVQCLSKLSISIIYNYIEQNE